MNKERFHRLINEAKEDQNIIGFFLVGSRGKGKSTEHSDYDIEVVVKDEVADEYKKKYSEKETGEFGFRVFSFSDFKEHATVGGPQEWDKPRYLHVDTLVDKNRKIQKLIDEKSRIPEERVDEYVSGHLDGYINYLYRSLKCVRDENEVGARLEASRSIHIFLKVIFGFEGRVAPFYKYLEWELGDYPLKKFPLKGGEIIDNLFKILDGADVEAQLKLFRAVKEACEDDYPDLIKEWEGKIQNVLQQIENE